MGNLPTQLGDFFVIEQIREDVGNTFLLFFIFTKIKQHQRNHSFYFYMFQLLETTDALEIRRICFMATHADGMP